MLTIAPRPAAFITGNTACMPRKTPTTLTSNSRRNCSAVVDCRSPKARMPALLTSTSSRPCFASISRTVADHAPASVTSRCRARARGPTACTVAASSFSRTSLAITVAPAAAKTRVIAAPMPRAAPVTSTTLPSKSNPSAIDSSGKGGSDEADAGLADRVELETEAVAGQRGLERHQRPGEDHLAGIE